MCRSDLDARFRDDYRELLAPQDTRNSIFISDTLFTQYLLFNIPEIVLTLFRVHYIHFRCLR